jgi:hypothetical protein
MTDKYDNDNAEHRRIRLGIEEGNGIPRMVGTEAALEALRKAGFEIEYHEILGLNDQIPWYMPLEGSYTGNLALTSVGVHCTDILVSVQLLYKLCFIYD